MLLMLRHRIHRVLVREGEAVVGILGQLELMAFVASHSHLIALQAAEAADLTELRAAARQIENLVRVLHQDGVRVDVIASLVSELNRQVFARLWELIAPQELRDEQLPRSSWAARAAASRSSGPTRTTALLLRDGFACGRRGGRDRGLQRRAGRLRLSAVSGRDHAEPAAVAPVDRRVPRRRCATGSTAAIRRADQPRGLPRRDGGGRRRDAAGEGARRCARAGVRQRRLLRPLRQRRGAVRRGLVDTPSRA